MPSRGAVCGTCGVAGAARPVHARGDRRQHLQTLAESAHGPPQPFARLGGAGRTGEGSTIFTVNAGGSLVTQSRRRKIVSSLSIFVDRMLMAPTDGAFACAAAPPASLHLALRHSQRRQSSHSPIGKCPDRKGWPADTIVVAALEVDDVEPRL